MKRIFTTVLILFISISSWAQSTIGDFGKAPKLEHMEGKEVICPARHVDENTFRDVPADVKARLEAKKKLRPAGEKAAKFNVLYDEDMPEVAVEAYKRAVEIWASLLNSSVTINVAAVWQDLGSNVLGSAIPATYYRNFAGAKKANAWFPVALAEKIAGKDLNSPNNFDIVTRFSSSQDWYFDSEGTPAVGQFDFTSVVLHELCHGLGFVSSFTVDQATNQGSFGIGTAFPLTFDSYIINEKNQALIDTTQFKNPSSELRKELISENLFFNSAAAIFAGGAKVRLYAPVVYDAGSSISHLDDKTYPAGSENSLMTYAAGLREVNYDPGRITRAMMNDMGWRGITIDHQEFKNFSKATEVEVKAKIFSDTTLQENTATLNYAVLNPSGLTLEKLNEAMKKPEKVQLKRIGSTNEFSAKLPISLATAVVAYYLSVTDSEKNEGVSPAGFRERPHIFFVGQPDKWGPSVEYYPPTIIRSGVDIDFLANVEDDYQEGIDSVYVEYAINGTKKAPFGLRKFDPAKDAEFSQGVDDINAFISKEAIPKLSDNDVVTFTLTAIDAAGNKTTIPTTAGGTSNTDKPVIDEYEFAATTLQDKVNSYFTTFDQTNTDFAMLGFNINTPTGLTNGALNTDHPHKNGLGLYYPPTYEDGSETNDVILPFEYEAIALFRKPIVVKKDSATISFDEIVLVEPGEDGVAFGEEGFWDYVVVEISPNSGRDWYALEDGYDCRKEKAWQDLYTSTITPANATNPTSNGTPSVALYRTHEINMNDLLKNNFNGGEILLRFRLFADQWARGWGWAIDNLAIQQPKPKPLANETEPFDLTISPNPASDYLDLKAKLTGVDQADIEIYQLTGKKVFSKHIALVNNELTERVHTKNYAAGTYLLTLKTEKGLRSRKFVVVK